MPCRRHQSFQLSAEQTSFCLELVETDDPSAGLEAATHLAQVCVFLSVVCVHGVMRQKCEKCVEVSFDGNQGWASPQVPRKFFFLVSVIKT